MDMLKVHSMEDISSLPHTKWSIQQPATAEGRENPLTSGRGLDLILVPGLGFTEVGGCGAWQCELHAVLLSSGRAPAGQREGKPQRAMWSDPQSLSLSSTVLSLRRATMMDTLQSALLLATDQKH